MKGLSVHIAPAAEKIISHLPPGLKDKVKNALRDISRGEVGTTIALSALDKTVIASPRSRRPGILPGNPGRDAPATCRECDAPRNDGNRAVSLHLYKAGRFRILFRRTNGTVWVDALTLEPVPKFALEERKSMP